MHAPALPPELDGPRPLRASELEPLLEMLNDIFRVSAGRPPTVATDWAHVYVPDNLENVRVIADGERLVASAGIWPNTVWSGDVDLRVAGVNLVGTYPEYRRLGLAERLLHTLHQRMHQLACPVGLLSTDIVNFYRRLGWELAGKRRIYRLNRGNHDLLPELTPDRRAYFAEYDVTPDLARLRAADRLGAARTPNAFAAQRVARGQPHIFVAERNGVVEAYLLLKDNTVIEWAGEDVTVAGLLRACFSQLDDPAASTSTRDSARRPVAFSHLGVVAPATGHALISRLDQLRIPYETSYLGMLYIADPAAVLNAYSIHDITVETTVIAGKEHVRLRRGRELVELDRSRLAKLLFGPERVCDFAEELFPLPFWQWELDKV
jgi:ribosomal protein S18 acetylase RimI-like enzyme